MVKNLFKFLEKNEVVLNKETKDVVTEAFKSEVKKETDKFLKEGKLTDRKVKELSSTLREAGDEIKGLRTSIVEKVESEVKLFEEKLVNKISKFLDVKVKESIPSALYEAQAKLEVYGPLVESIKGMFETKGIKINSKGFGVLKEAKDEIMSLTEKLDGEIKKNLELEEATEKVLGKFLLKEKVDGLTPDQSKKVTNLLEGASYDEIEDRFDAVRALVLEDVEDEDVKTLGRVDEEFSPVDKTSKDGDEWGASHVI